MIPEQAVQAAAEIILQGDTSLCECRHSPFDKHDVNPPCSTRKWATVKARRSLEAAAPFLLATQHVTETQLRESNTARQERIWALEAALKAARTGKLRNPWELWQMYARENKERLRLLERNRRLTAKIVRRSHVIGELRDANRRMLAQLIGSGQRVPE